MQDKNSGGNKGPKMQDDSDHKNSKGGASQKDKIEKPLKQKQLKGKTSFVCAGNFFFK